MKKKLGKNPPMKASTLKALKKLVQDGDGDGALSKLQDLHEGLEKWMEKRFKEPKKRH